VENGQALVAPGERPAVQTSRCGRKQPQPANCRLRIMRDPSQPFGRRDEMAKAAAPFCHSRLSSVEHSGEIARPTVIRAPAVSATLDEWQAEYAPGAKEKQ